MAIYPSQEWCDEWKKAINDDEAVARTGKNWGVDFNGNWLFEVQLKKTPGLLSPDRMLISSRWLRGRRIS